MHRFASHNTCLVLIDVWPLNFDGNDSRLDAIQYTRRQIARTLTAAQQYDIPVWAQNSFLPYPNNPPELVEALQASNLQFCDNAFQPPGTIAHWFKFAKHCRQEWFANTVHYSNFRQLVYMGYYLDECVANANNGFVATSNNHEVYLLKDAGLTNRVCEPSSFNKYWGPFPDEDNVHFALAHAALFCDGIASQVVHSITVQDFIVSLSKE